MNEVCFHLGIKGVIMNEKGELLLLRVNPEQLGNYKGPAYWDLPGGRVQRAKKKKRKIIEETLLREIKEETKLKEIRVIKPLSMVISNLPVEKNKVGLILWIYLCEALDTSPIEISKEHTKHSWFSPIKAASLLRIKYPKQATDAIRSL